MPCSRLLFALTEESFQLRPYTFTKSKGSKEQLQTKRKNGLCSTSLMLKRHSCPDGNACAIYKQKKFTLLIEFFRIEIHRIYRICRQLYLIVSKLKMTKNGLLQIV